MPKTTDTLQAPDHKGQYAAFNTMSFKTYPLDPEPVRSTVTFSGTPGDSCVKQTQVIVVHRSQQGLDQHPGSWSHN